MDQYTQQLVTYIRQQRAAGFDDAQIGQALLHVGWAQEWVRKGISESHVEKANDEATNSVDADLPSVYRVSTAATDFVLTEQTVAEVYWRIVAGAVLASLLFVALSWLIVSTLVFRLAGMNFETIPQILGAFSLLLIFGTFVQSLVSAFILGSMVIPLDDNEADEPTVVPVLRSAFQQSYQVLGANLRIATVLYWPFVLLCVLPAVLLAKTSFGSNMIAIFPIIFLCCVIWTCYAYLRYGLAPLVPLFEPDIPSKLVFSRSDELLRHGGRMFLLKIIGIFFALAIITRIVMSSQLLPSGPLFGIVMFSVGAIVITIAHNGLMIMLYQYLTEVE